MFVYLRRRFQKVFYPSFFLWISSCLFLILIFLLSCLIFSIIIFSDARFLIAAAYRARPHIIIHIGCFPTATTLLVYNSNNNNNNKTWRFLHWKTNKDLITQHYHYETKYPCLKNKNLISSRSAHRACIHTRYKNNTLLACALPGTVV